MSSTGASVLPTAQELWAQGWSVSPRLLLGFQWLGLGLRVLCLSLWQYALCNHMSASPCSKFVKELWEHLTTSGPHYLVNKGERKLLEYDVLQCS